MAKTTSNYQELSTELKNVLTELQQPDVDIDRALELYKKGQALAHSIEEHLKQAEIKVQNITLSKATK